MNNFIIPLCCILFLGLQLMFKNADLEHTQMELEVTRKQLMDEIDKNYDAVYNKGFYQSVLLEAAQHLEACTHESQFDFAHGILKRFEDMESWVFIPYPKEVESWMLVPEQRYEGGEEEEEKVIQKIKLAIKMKAEQLKELENVLRAG